MAMIALPRVGTVLERVVWEGRNFNVGASWARLDSTEQRLTVLG